MNFFSPRVWTAMDIALLKWSSLLLGLVIGAHFSGFGKKHSRMLVSVSLLLALKPSISFFSKS